MTTQAVLLDLGNVVFGVDFRRVFAAWARAAGVDEQVFYDRWAADDWYGEHECGRISFERYTETLAERFGVQMTVDEWRAGWNDLWTAPFHSVVDLLPVVARHYPLYAFTNTNHTHAACWRAMYPDALRHFRHVFVSSEIGLRKPDGEAFQHVCDTMEMPPAGVLFLDDTQENVQGAAALGLDARLVSSEAQVAEALRALPSITR